MTPSLFRRLLAATLAVVVSSSVGSAEEPKITTNGAQVNFFRDGKLVARFMAEHDTFTPERHTETYKPYLHVFSPTDETRLTKGPGGQFPHHRGLFVGYNKIDVGGKKYDRWHMTGGDQVTKHLFPRTEGDVQLFDATIDWQGAADAKEPILIEKRSFELRGPSKPFYLTIEMTSTLTSTKGEVLLDGDPEHAGAQFRPSEKIDPTKTEYLFPGENVDAHKATDLPWAAEIFTVEGKTFTVAILNHPDNARGTRFSAYRDYGRFGAFPVLKASADAPAKLHYKWLIAEGEVRDAAVFQTEWNKFAGKNEPIPQLTVKSAEQPAPKKPDAPKKGEPAKKPVAK